MTATRRALVAGNWKMNGLRASIEVLDAVITGASDVNADLLLCPPATLIAAFAERAAGTALSVGAQDCHTAASGAHTGDIGASMLADAGASSVIVGHSERRADHGETDALVKAKAEAVAAAGLMPIVCVGESEAERDAGRALDVVGRQLDGSLPDAPGSLVIAYEPVWAIGTGRVPGLGDIDAMHAFMRENITARYGEAGRTIRLLYGGSVKPGNAAEIFAIDGVDGGLVGGASLKAADFLGIAAAC